MRAALLSAFVTGQPAAPALVGMYVLLDLTRPACTYACVDAAREEGTTRKHHAYYRRLSRFGWTPSRPRAVCLSSSWAVLPGHSGEEEQDAAAWLFIGLDWCLSNPLVLVENDTPGLDGVCTWDWVLRKGACPSMDG